MTQHDPSSDGPGGLTNDSPQTESGQLSVLPEYASPAQAAPATNGSMWLEEPDGGGEGIKISGLLHSMRRRWMLCTGLGVLCATLVAGLLWWFVPVEVEAIALIQVRREQPQVLTQAKSVRGTDRAYELFKATQRDLLKSFFVLHSALDEPGISQIPMVRREDNQIEWLMKELQANMSTESEMIQLTLKGENKDDAVRIVNAVLDAYEEQVINKEIREQTQRLNKLREQTIELDKEKKRASDRFAELSEQSVGVDSEVAKIQQQQLLMEIRDLTHKRSIKEQELSKLMSQFLTTNAVIEAGATQPSEFEILDMLEYDPEYAEAKYELTFAEKELKRLSRMLKPGSIGLMRSQRQIAYQRNELAKLQAEKTPRIVARIRRMKQADPITAKSFISPLRQNIQLINQEIAALDKRITEEEEDFRQKTKVHTELRQVFDQLENMKEFGKTMHEEIQSLEVNLRTDPRIQVIQRATVPRDSNFLIVFLEIAGAWTLVFGLTVLGVALWDYQGKRVNTTKDVDMPHAGLHVVGSLPTLSSQGPWPFSRLDQKSLEVVLNFAVDSIRASLLFNRSRGQLKVVMVTSAQGQEGRSTVASQLAVSMARAGKRTLLLDADVRNPQQHLVFSVNGHQGFCELLRQEVSVENAVQDASVDNLWLLAAGRYDQRSMQALSGPTAKTVFQQLREHFDMVIVDIGPVLTSADALLVGQHVDTALISVRRDVSQIPKIYSACDRLRSVGIDIMGAVVNGAGTEIRQNELQAVRNQAALPDSRTEEVVTS